MNNSRHATVIAGHAIFRHDNKMLLLLRKGGYSNGMYNIPAGHIEKGERITEGLARELNEEIGVTVSPDALNLISVVHQYSLDPAYVHFFFEVTQWQGTPTNQEPDKCSELRWFDTNNLPENIVPFVQEVISNDHDKKPPLLIEK